MSYKPQYLPSKQYIMRKRIIFFLIFVVSFVVKSSAQNISLIDMQNILKMNNLETVSQFMSDKNWQYYDSQKGDEETYTIVTWTYGKERYEDKAVGWFYAYFYNKKIDKVRLFFVNVDAYKKINASIKPAGYVAKGSDVSDGNITSMYVNNLFCLNLTTEKSKDDDFDSSKTTYSIDLFRKGSSIDPNNGEKRIIQDDGKYVIYSLVNGKIEGKAKTFNSEGVLIAVSSFKDDQLNGVTDIYYEDSGKIHVTRNFKDGKLEGKETEYDEKGQVIKMNHYVKGHRNGEFSELVDDSTIYKGTYKNNELNGVVRGYKNGNLFVERNYINGIKSGTVKYFDKDGRVWREGNYVDDLEDGVFITYLGANRTIVENYSHGELNGERVNTTVLGDSKYNSTSTYKNGILNGPFKWYGYGFLSEDCPIIPLYYSCYRVGSYTNGNLEGRVSHYNVKEESKHKIGENSVSLSEDDYYLAYEEFYANNKLNGECKKYDEKGEMFESKQYKNGTLDGYMKLSFSGDLRDTSSSRHVKLYLQRDELKHFTYYLDTFRVHFSIDSFDYNNVYMNYKWYQNNNLRIEGNFRMPICRDSLISLITSQDFNACGYLEAMERYRFGKEIVYDALGRVLTETTYNTSDNKKTELYTLNL